jgi:membrane-bound serine protease (ClpP class)
MKQRRLVLVLATLSISALAAASPTKPAPSPSPTAVTEEEREGQRTTVHKIVVDATINPATADFIREAIFTASSDGAAALIVQLDTPGGLLDSTKSIVKDFLGAPLPVIVYVAPSGSGATSAGVFITMAANIAAMAPGTNIGAAHPVGGQGETIDGDLGEKVENFAASMSKSIAQERGRNVEWAEKAVRESVSVTEQEALELKVIDLVAGSVDDLLRQAEGRKVEVRNQEVTLRLANAEVVVHEMRLKHKVLNVLANPNVAYLLMMAAMLGLYVEFTSPGLFFPGVVGAICLLLGLTSLQVLPINYGGLLLVGLGFLLMVLELSMPSFGALGIGGLVSFILGSLLLFDTPESDLTVDPMIVYAAAATFGGATLIAAFLVVRTQRTKPALGIEGLIGETAEVRQRIGGGRQRGKVFVHGEYWNAVAEEAIEANERVEITAMEGMSLTVRRLGSGPTTGA